MTEPNADSLYADLRKQGEITVGYHLMHLLPGVRYRARRDGLKYRQLTKQHGGTRARVNMWNRRQRSTTFWLEDDNGHVYRPDA